MAELHGHVLTPHAHGEMERRRVDLETVAAVIAAPEQRLSVRPGRDVLQSRVTMDSKTLYRQSVRRHRSRPAGHRNRLSHEQGGKVLDPNIMKATYDQRTDTLTLVLKTGVQVAESDEDKPGVILDYDAEGHLVSIEVLDASKRVDEADRIELETTMPR